MPTAKKCGSGRQDWYAKPILTDIQDLSFATHCHPLRWQSFNGHIACKSLKNNEIHSFEVANRGFGIVATFLHTRSFNILRRSGSGVKRKSSENQ